ncbi:MAG: 16S rRNA (cytosine(1402)-N(4))-methyltransferase RsmH [Anaerolineales bacterium]|nr:16S rRNA (cytosine(1402)-N(4))-methyltransferase RsmH [Anaerolineales bacterium]
MNKDKVHESVLYNEIIHALQPNSSGLYVDCTVGAGGHARGILEACAPGGRLLGFDLDPQALAISRETLAPYGDRVQLVQASYTSLKSVLKEMGWDVVDGILLDLGVSSMQLDTPERGFSFQEDGPLDMRFGPETGLKAADLVNNATETELADMIFRYGEDRLARRIARAIVKSRPLRSTSELSQVIRQAVRNSSERIHPATRTFQALRIAVNQELETVRDVLPQALEALTTGGRLAVISFHSLEDRIVKEFMHRESRNCLCPPKQPICTCGHKATIKEIRRKPVWATEQEIKDNPRARSARLRVVEKIG